MNEPEIDIELEYALSVTETALAKMADEARLRILERLFDKYCLHCGREQGEWSCQCENDE